MASGETYAQYGEDLLINAALSQLENLTYSCIEFGAADGLFCSNTAHLWRDSGWSALLIENDEELHQQLIENVGERLGRTVAAERALVRNLDDFTRLPCDVCSIDIDGNEYQILEQLKTRHRVLVVEHNPTVPPHVEMVNEVDSMQGSSALSLVRLAQEKGYGLIGATTCNLVFVRDEEQLPTVDLETVFDHSCLNYVVTDYHGRYEMIGKWPYGFTEERHLGLK